MSTIYLSDWVGIEYLQVQDQWEGKNVKASQFRNN